MIWFSQFSVFIIYFHFILFSNCVFLFCLLLYICFYLFLFFLKRKIISPWPLLRHLNIQHRSDGPVNSCKCEPAVCWNARLIIWWRLNRKSARAPIWVSGVVLRFLCFGPVELDTITVEPENEDREEQRVTQPENEGRPKTMFALTKMK